MAHHWEILFRSVLLYLLIIVTFRLMGKREVGELSVIDLVVTIMLAEIASMAIENTKDHLIHTLIPIIAIVALQILFAYISLKSKRFRDLIDGRPSIIINKGTIDEKAMKKQRYNFDDLLVQLREKNIRNISDVEFAILETSGKLSVFKKEPQQAKKKKSNQGDITMPLIIDGFIQEENLKRINKTSSWLKQELKKLGAPQIEGVSFCSYDKGEFYIDKSDKK
ncbi:DUF421 domain-containing protein [Neobacillus notoginsengisoli]|uniref:DUF421 domain-containing protein n=1 Tax=Neobacillus notoginsengisoli TaxID=1578198 RepID=A0A417YTX1_9BACI|nr:DUF421 domain-containing protein [Neobacillus notoginsengisoli]RHW40610.1 DUF421 domain-containing protein [Neobacillus notoginsengisoli]